MRAHALALLLVVALVTPATPGKGAQPASGIHAQAQASSPDQAQAATALLDQGQQLVRLGEYARAEQFYADTAVQSADRA